jgi:hypothetical protein
MAGTLSPSPFQISKSFPEIRSTIPRIARRSSERFQLRRQLWRAISFNPCVVGEIWEYHYVCLIEGFVSVLSIRRSHLQFAINQRISSRLRQTSSSLVSKLHCFSLRSSFSTPQGRSPPSLPFSLFAPPASRRPWLVAGARRPPRPAAEPPPSCPWWL